MVSLKKMQEIMSFILIIGMLLSLVFVVLGGALYLIQYGNENLNIELLQAKTYHPSLQSVWQLALSFSPSSMIELGLLLLVFTQVLRIGLLTWFYIAIRDYWFIFFSAFILLVLTYSLFWRH